jgi:probable rRNA maturation factor
MKTANSATRARPKQRPGKPQRLRLAVQYATRSRSVPTEAQFRRWARAALHADAEVTLRIVDTAEGLDLNRRYRGKDYATNVLTFIMHGAAPYAGDLALCAPIVTREARAQSKDRTAHYAHLIVHGILHLQGFDHETPREAKKMEALEKRILKRLGYPDPYAAPQNNGRKSP